MLDLLALLGPLALAEPPLSSTELDMWLQHIETRQIQLCLMNEQRARVRRGEAREDRYWPFAMLPFDVARDRFLCMEGDDAAD